MARIEVELDVFSGNPNPSWEMPSEKVKEFFEIGGWKELMNPEDHGVSLDLGYRGFIVSVLSEEDEDQINLPTSPERKIKSDTSTTKKLRLPRTFRIYGSKELNVGNNDLKPSLSLEGIQEKEKWLLQTYNQARNIKTELSSAITEYVNHSISTGGSVGDKSRMQQEERQEAQLASPDVLATCNLRCAIYNPTFWNDSYSITHNNCYNYASNSRTNTVAQPGRAHGCTFTNNCSSVYKAAICDGLTNTCGSNPVYLVALVIWPGNDYHWYHWHGAGSDYFWGHKPGYSSLSTARNWDGSGKRLVPPLQPNNCNRGPYTIFCGYYYQPTGAYIR